MAKKKLSIISEAEQVCSVINNSHMKGWHTFWPKPKFQRLKKIVEHCSNTIVVIVVEHQDNMA